MNASRATLLMLVAILIAAMVAVPDTSQSAEAATADDVLINVDGGNGSIDISMGSGSTKTVILYVTNLSSSYLSLDVPSAESDVVDVSSRISIGGTESNIIYPAGDSEGRHIAVVTLTLNVDNLADTQSFSGEIRMTFTDLGLPPESNVFTESVPFTVNINSVYTSEGSYNQFFGLFPNTLPDPFDEPWFTALVTPKRRRSSRAP